MRVGTYIRIAVALMLGVAAAVAQEALETRGAWRLVPDGPDFALRTQATDAPDSTLALHCRKAQDLYAFEIKSPALGGRPSSEDIRVGFKVDDEDQTWLTLATGADGTIPIAHQTAFWIIYGAVTRSGAKDVAFTAADHTWRFALDGLRDLTESLMARCGFEPRRLQPDRRRTPQSPSR
jgi:hypothetical protein